MDAMRRAWGWLSVLVSSCALATATAQQPVSIAATQMGQPTESMSAADRETQTLLEQLSRASDNLVRNIQSPQAWRYQIEQADLLLHLAGRSRKAPERDNWLKMAIDSYYSAAVQSADNEPAPQQRLAQLPAQIAQAFPGHTLIAYAALREIQAEYTRALAKGEPSKAQEHLRQRLLRFAEQHPNAPDAPKAIMDAAHLSESLGQTAEACRCYRTLADHHPGQPLCRQARGALRRLGGLDGQTVELRLPRLYASGAQGDSLFNLKELRGSLVVVYFWSSSSPKAAEVFNALKQITDRYQYRGLEVVYVNLDGDPARAKEFLAGRLTAGTHVYQAKGLEGGIAERYGIQDLPHLFVVGKDGGLLRHSVEPGQLDAALAGQLPRVK
jgi:hypothetical protein